METLAVARRAGFAPSLVYVALNNSERNISRVQIRVAEGGHDVPDEDVRPRYVRSLVNAVDVIKLVDQAIVFDNSGPEHRKVLTAENGRVKYVADDFPAWALPLLLQ